MEEITGTCFLDLGLRAWDVDVMVGAATDAAAVARDVDGDECDVAFVRRGVVVVVLAVPCACMACAGAGCRCADVDGSVVMLVLGTVVMCSESEEEMSSRLDESEMPSI